MPLVLSELEREFAAQPLVSPYSSTLATAVVSDVFRRAGHRAPQPELWTTLALAHPARFAEQLGMLAHLLAATSLGAVTVEGLGVLPRDPPAPLTRFFEEIEPLTAEMIRGNAFRREELVRKWLAAFGGSVAGESVEESAHRVQALDYRATLAEYAKAEAARSQEATERARLIKEAAEREAAARGWRE